MNVVILNAVGDISFSGKISMKSNLDDIIHPDLRKILNDSDILVGNFEVPFSNLLFPYTPYTRKEFAVSLKSQAFLSDLKFTLLSLANNHILDWGPEGIEITREILSSYNIATIGAGMNLYEAQQPFIINSKGILFGFLAACKEGIYSATSTKAGAAPVKEILNIIPKIRKKVNFLILLLH